MYFSFSLDVPRILSFVSLIAGSYLYCNAAGSVEPELPEAEANAEESIVGEADLVLGLPFAEVGGLTVDDTSGSNNHGTLSGVVVRSVSGKFGRALRFDGTGGRVELDSLDVQGAEITIAAWIRPTGFRVSDGRIVSKASGVRANDHIWMLSTFDDDGIKARFRLQTQASPDTKTLVGSTSLVEGVWTHVAATFDGLKMRLYVNGALDGELLCRGAIRENPSVPVSIGDQPQGGRPFEGLIDEVRIFSRELGPNGIEALMAKPLIESEATPPALSPPVSLSAKRISAAQVQLSWEASPKKGDVFGYRVYRDGVFRGVSSNLQFLDEGLDSEKRYEYFVKAVDLAGRASSRSSIVSVDAESGGVTEKELENQLLVESAGGAELVALTSEVGLLASVDAKNAIVNGDFETNVAPWRFYTNGAGSASVSSPAYAGVGSVKMEIGSRGSNIQLFQNDLSLRPNTEYVLSFAAYSSSGNDFRVSVGKHTSPYSNYGLNRERIDLTRDWQVYSLSFTTMNFSSEVDDGRLYFWLSDDAEGGDDYFIDAVSLSPFEGFELDVQVSGDGAIEGVPVSGLVKPEQELELFAVPEDGWVFDRWSGGISSRDNPFSLIATEDLEIHALFLPDGDRSIIDIWYGDDQEFGSIGIPQSQVNLLGNILIPDFIESLSFSLNGVPRGELSIGDEANIRLGGPGDFNVEILLTDLIEGENVVELLARGLDGSEFSREVSFSSSIFSDWPLPYSIDWSEVSRIDEVAQVVDGKWELVEGGVRVVESHYDRLIAIGDIDWTDYEVTVPITVHSVGDQGAPNEPLVGVLMRWTGHSQKRWNEQPGTEWRPIGAIGAYGWYEDGSRGGPRFHILESGVKKSSGYDSEQLPLEVSYFFKVRVESEIPGSPGFYRFKAWPADEPEPKNWGITRQADDGLLNGSLALVAHYVTATFGDIEIVSLAIDTTPPSAPEELEASILDSGHVALGWAESIDDVGVVFYRVLRDGEAIAEVAGNSYVDDSTQSDKTYRYQIVAFDGAGNGSALSNEVFARNGDVPDASAGLWLGYRFEENDTERVFDESPNFNDGTLLQGVAREEHGRFGSALKFDGKGGQVSLGNLDIPGSEFTISAWIRPDSFEEHDSRIISKAMGVREDDHYWMISSINDDGIKARVRLKLSSGVTTTLIGKQPLPVGVWTHLAAAFDGTELSLIVNGVKDVSMPLAGAIAQNDQVPAAVGDQPGGGRNFDGLIDEVRIYQYAMTQEQISALMGRPLPPVGDPDLEVPSVPDNLGVSIVGKSQARLAWDESDDNVGVVGYRIYRNGALLSSVVSPTYLDEGLAEGEVYRYSVSAYDRAGNESGTSSEVLLETLDSPQAPEPPESLQVDTLSDSQLELSWQASIDDGVVVEYRIFRDGGLVGTSVVETFIDTGLAPGTTYSYQVRAVDDESAVSELSLQAFGTTAEASTGEPARNALINGGFEDGLSFWAFYTNGSGEAEVDGDAYAGSSSVKLSVNSRSSNVQLYQNDIVLEPNTEYRLSFVAFSNSSRDFRISLGKHASPFTNYGLNRVRIDLTDSWKSFSVDFTTTGFASKVEDGRLFFWLASDARPGDVYSIDRITLTPLSDVGEEDNQAPSAPQNLTGTVLSGPRIAVSWDESSDDEGVSFYEVVRDSQVVADVYGTSFVDSSVVPGQVYVYKVHAHDAAGNVSEESATIEIQAGEASEPQPNAIANGSFEEGLADWTFYTSGKGVAANVSPSFDGSKAVEVSLDSRASNVQLFQNELQLEPDTNYTLSFRAYSNSGRDFRVAIGKHSSPYTSYGLPRTRADLSSAWQVFSFDFKTTNFASVVSDGRLYFWFASDARAGDVYRIDQIVLSKSDI
ncbi:Carbohydrate binding domain protein [Verrucomicrobiia bacterium DG1235]|nr:Carbohydrate binding domain protein [Verrucomicrobiae bacterium DG1235]